MTREKRDVCLFILLSCILVSLCIALLKGIRGGGPLFFYAGAFVFGAQQLLLLFVGTNLRRKRSPDEAATRDSLTGTLSESRMEDAVRSFLQSDARGSGSWALICMELMSFEHFSATFGRETGDRLLRVVGGTLLQNYSCVTRCEGDRFAFLARNSPSLENLVKETLSNDVAEALGRQHLNMIDFRFGICPLNPEDPQSPRDLYYAARLALKSAKSEPGMSAVVYDDRLQERLKLERCIEINMLYALSREEFQVFVQPKFRVSDGTCCSGEALIRWHSAELGPLTPDRFIPIFEKNGFIAEIDFFVLDFVLQNIQRTLKEGGRALPISVNQSKVTIGFPNYLQRLQSLVRRYSVPLQYVDLEVTESILETDSDTLYSFIYAIKELGFTISLDDFGSGYSSLNALQNLPVDTLKLDREFLMRTDIHEKNKIIVRNVVNMARDLGLKVVCEGVETEEQFEFLRKTGCDYAQGYYCARPMPFAEYERKFLTNPAPTLDRRHAPGQPQR